VTPRDDASLTAGERAALAGLEASAAAQDPWLARRLSGASRLPVIVDLRRILMAGRPGWWGASLILIGLILVVLSLSTAWALGVVGSLITMGGLCLIAASVARRSAKPRPIGPS
jgi:hypothetical protein